MVSRDKDYGMPPLCPWSADSRTYDGLCSHFSVREGVRDAFEGLTAEDIESLDAEIKLRHSRRDKATCGSQRLGDDQRRYEKKSRRVEKFKCHTCNFAFPTRAFLRRHYKTQKHADNVAGKVHLPIQSKSALHKPNKESRRFYCTDCDHAATTQQNLNTHYKSAKHLRNVGASSS